MHYNMKTNELINLLQLLPPNMKVVVRGQEEGYNDIVKLEPVNNRFNGKIEWYYGRYTNHDNTDAIRAIALIGKNTTGVI